MLVDFTICGEPAGKGRPRFRRMGNYVSTYTDAKTTNYENLVKLEYKNQCGNKYFEPNKPLIAAIYCYFSRPKNIPKKKLHLYDEDKIFPTKKPDTDNIAKIILDSLNKVAFDDDKQVIVLKVVKKFAKEQPHVRVIITDEFGLPL